MKHITEFSSFLNDTVNLNKTRVDLLESSIDAIKTAVRGSGYTPRIVRFEPQGSWAHKTIIRPQSGKAFDADLLMFVDPVDGWTAANYIDELFSKVKAISLYSEKVVRYSHCITIEYVGDRKIDIAPVVVDRQWFVTNEVCNRSSNEFEISKPTEYTDWLIEQNRITGSNNFRKATRLIKYLRDIKGTFTCPSFLLTTLQGMQVNALDILTTPFSDVPSTLKILIGRLDDWLQARPTVPEVRNPVLSTEIQSEAWDESKYLNFRDRINHYRVWIDEAFDEPDRIESVKKWRKLFGEDFAPGISTNDSRSESVIAADGNNVLAGSIDLVAKVIRIGLAALPSHFNSFPHMERPTWTVASKQDLTVKIAAGLFSDREAEFIRPVKSLDVSPPGKWIRFDAKGKSNLPLPETFKVVWRITNTDTGRVRLSADQLRGGFYPSDQHGVRWEQLSYRGVHLVEAFVVRKVDNMQIGRSSTFYVGIQ